MIKVDEPVCEYVWQCPRCKEYYCGDCVDTHEVDFDIEDEPEGYNEMKMQWKGLLVCPWCYNQLIEKSKKREINKGTK